MDPGLTSGAIGAAFVFGLRHGVDWDHIAAIVDITGSQTSRRGSLILSTLYALGHALVVMILGTVAIVLGASVPSSLDAVMERLVGATLLALGGYLVYSLIRHGKDLRMQSRWMLVLNALRRTVRRLRGRPDEIIEFEHEHEHDHGAGHDHTHDVALDPVDGPAPTFARTIVRTHTHRHIHRVRVPDDPFVDYGGASAFGIGMLHGVGAETPTQIILFVTAAGIGGRGAGVVLLAAFVVGLLATNTLVALASAFGFGREDRRRNIYLAIGILAAAFSLVLGSLYVLGRGDLLPPLL